MGHPEISSLFLADHLQSRSQTAAPGMPAVQLSADDTKVPGTVDAHTADHFQQSLPSEIHSICYLLTECLGFNEWENEHSPTRNRLLAVFLSTSTQKLAKVTVPETSQVVPQPS